MTEEQLCEKLTLLSFEGPRGRGVANSEDDEDGRRFQGSEGTARIRVAVIKVVDPAEFYFTMDDMNGKYVELNKLMNKFYSVENEGPGLVTPKVGARSSPGQGTSHVSDPSSPSGDSRSTPKKPRKWEPGDPCAVEVDGQWKRGVVEAEPFETVEVKLVDEVKEVTVPVDALRHLLLRFRRLGDRVTRCCLGGIQPADGSSWTPSSILEFQGFVEGNPNLYIHKMKNYNVYADLPSLPVELFGSKIWEASCVPMKASESWICLNQWLCVKGFAKVDTLPCKNKHTGERQVLNVMEDERTVIAYLMNETFTTTPNRGGINMGELSEVPKALKLRWFPAEPVDIDVISGKVTFVGKNCEIYIQNCESSADQTLKIINDEVHKVCERTEPSDIKWEVGDICLARFDLDSKWYRGEILQGNTYQGQNLVRFVDYGNCEYVKNEDLRLAIGLTMRPLQVQVCYFDNFTSLTPEWELLHLEGIHRLLVDQMCRIELRWLKTGFLGIVNMYLPDETNAVDLMVSKGFGQYMYPPDKNDEGHIFWRDIHNKVTGYKLLKIPYDVESFLVEIAAILSPDMFLIKVCGTENAELKLQLEAFVDLQATMQDEAESLPFCDPMDEFNGCISNYEGIWYRAAVLSGPSDRNTVTLQYVDYGNIEEKSVEEVKHVKDVWHSVPAHAIPCRIFGYKYSGNIPRQEAIQTLQRKFSPQDNMVATIKKRGETILEVELHSDAGVLLYQDLIDSEFYIPC